MSDWPGLAVYIFVGLLAWGILSAYLALKKGRKPVKFFLLGLVLGPIGLVITVIVVEQKPGEFATGEGPLLTVRYLHDGTDIDDGILQFQWDRLSFIQKKRRYRLDIPYRSIQSARILEMTDVPNENPQLIEMLSGREFLLEVEYSIGGQQNLEFFAGGLRLSMLATDNLIPLLSDAAIRSQFAIQPVAASLDTDVVCPSCGKIMPSSSKFCSDCGAELAKTAT